MEYLLYIVSSIIVIYESRHHQKTGKTNLYMLLMALALVLMGFYGTGESGLNENFEIGIMILLLGLICWLAILNFKNFINRD